MSKWGEIQKKNVLVIDGIREIITLPLNDNPFERCCYNLCVFADLSNSDNYRNDWTSFLKIIPKSYSSVNMELEKYVNGVWTIQASLVNDTYGTFYPLGFETKGNNNLIGYRINWVEVLTAFDTGKYRVKFDLTSTAIYSDSYCLESFSQYAVDNSVRIEWLWDSVIGDRHSQDTRDFSGLDWWNQIRICNGIFGYKKGGFETESRRYENGFEDSVSKTYSEDYTMILRGLPIEVHDVIIYDLPQADEILITDYNSWNNSGSYIDKSVEISGAYEPNYQGINTKPSIQLTFKDRFSNRRKLYS